MVASAGYALVRAGHDFAERERDLLSFAQLRLAARERQPTGWVRAR